MGGERVILYRKITKRVFLLSKMYSVVKEKDEQCFKNFLI